MEEFWFLWVYVELWSTLLDKMNNNWTVLALWSFSFQGTNYSRSAVVFSHFQSSDWAHSPPRPPWKELSRFRRGSLKYSSDTVLNYHSRLNFSSLSLISPRRAANRRTTRLETLPLAPWEIQIPRSRPTFLGAAKTARNSSGLTNSLPIEGTFRRLGNGGRNCETEPVLWRGRGRYFCGLWCNVGLRECDKLTLPRNYLTSSFAWDLCQKCVEFLRSWVWNSRDLHFVGQCVK